MDQTQVTTNPDIHQDSQGLKTEDLSPSIEINHNAAPPLFENHQHLNGALSEASSSKQFIEKVSNEMEQTFEITVGKAGSENLSFPIDASELIEKKEFYTTDDNDVDERSMPESDVSEQKNVNTQIFECQEKETETQSERLVRQSTRRSRHCPLKNSEFFYDPQLEALNSYPSFLMRSSAMGDKKIKPGVRKSRSRLCSSDTIKWTGSRKKLMAAKTSIQDDTDNRHSKHQGLYKNVLSSEDQKMRQECRERMLSVLCGSVVTGALPQSCLQKWHGLAPIGDVPVDASALPVNHLPTNSNGLISPFDFSPFVEKSQLQIRNTNEESDSFRHFSHCDNENITSSDLPFGLFYDRGENVIGGRWAVDGSPGMQHEAKFSISRFGFEKAKEMAIIARRFQNRDLDWIEYIYTCEKAKESERAEAGSLKADASNWSNSMPDAKTVIYMNPSDGTSMRRNVEYCQENSRNISAVCPTLSVEQATALYCRNTPVPDHSDRLNYQVSSPHLTENFVVGEKSIKKRIKKSVNSGDILQSKRTKGGGKHGECLPTGVFYWKDAYVANWFDAKKKKQYKVSFKTSEFGDEVALQLALSAREKRSMDVDFLKRGCGIPVIEEMKRNDYDDKYGSSQQAASESASPSLNGAEGLHASPIRNYKNRKTIKNIMQDSDERSQDLGEMLYSHSDEPSTTHMKEEWRYPSNSFSYGVGSSNKIGDSKWNVPTQRNHLPGLETQSANTHSHDCSTIQTDSSYAPSRSPNPSVTPYLSLMPLSSSILPPSNVYGNLGSKKEANMLEMGNTEDEVAFDHSELGLKHGDGKTSAVAEPENIIPRNAIAENSCEADSGASLPVLHDAEPSLLKSNLNNASSMHAQKTVRENAIAPDSFNGQSHATEEIKPVCLLNQPSSSPHTASQPCSLPPTVATSQMFSQPSGQQFVNPAGRPILAMPPFYCRVQQVPENSPLTMTSHNPYDTRVAYAHSFGGPKDGNYQMAPGQGLQMIQGSMFQPSWHSDESAIGISHGVREENDVTREPFDQNSYVDGSHQTAPNAETIQGKVHLQRLSRQGEVSNQMYLDAQHSYQSTNYRETNEDGTVVMAYRDCGYPY